MTVELSLCDASPAPGLENGSHTVDVCLSSFESEMDDVFKNDAEELEEVCCVGSGSKRAVVKWVARSSSLVF